MKRKKLIPPAPAKLQGRTPQVFFSSQIARAQRISEARNINNWLGTLVQVAQFKPEVVALIDGIKLAKHTATLFGVPPFLLKDKAIFEAEQEAAAQNQNQQLEMDQNKQESETLKNVSSAAASLPQGV